MTAAQRATEAAETVVVYQAAMTMLGFKALADAIHLWSDVSSSPKQVNATAGRWLTYALSLTAKRREQTRDLTLAYARLHRALWTGSTFHNPIDGPRPSAESVRLSELRERFYDSVEDLAPEIYDSSPQEVPGAHDADEETFDVDVPDQSGDEDIVIDLLEAFGIDDLDDLEQKAEEEARIVLEALGPDNLLKKYERLDAGKPADDVDQQRTDAHRSAGNRQAAALERLVLNGGRDVNHELIRKDHRVVAWARVSKTGTPCGFCAMLISRGAIYKSKKSASLGASGDEYHDNCHCEPIPVYSAAHYESDASFGLNREYDQLWREFTSDYSGSDVLAGWRSFIRARNTDGQAQAA